MKKVAVTGASGHIGANLVRELLGRGYEVVALVRQTSRALDGLDVTRVRGDLGDMLSLQKAFSDVEQVYHLAACISIQSGHQDKLMAVNVEGTRNVISACLDQGVSTLVHFSSIDALDHGALAGDVSEENPLLGETGHRCSDYEYSKSLAEKLVRDCDSKLLSTRIIYPSAVIGPNDFKLSLMGQVILKLAQGQLPALVRGGYDWVDARDVSWGSVEAAEKGAGGDRYILSGHFRSVSALAGVVEELTGTAAPRLSVPIWLARSFVPVMGAWALMRGEQPLYTQDSLSVLQYGKAISHAKATQKLGFQPREFRTSIQDALNDYAEHHHLGLKDDGV